MVEGRGLLITMAPVEVVSGAPPVLLSRVALAGGDWEHFKVRADLLVQQNVSRGCDAME